MLDTSPITAKVNEIFFHVTLWWSELHHNQGHKGHKRSSHSTPPVSPMYQALVKISGGSTENTVLELPLGPHPLCRREMSRIKERDTVLKASGVVYEIPWGCGQKYIGETKRTLETCLKEHQAATKGGETEISNRRAHLV